MTTSTDRPDIRTRKAVASCSSISTAVTRGARSISRSVTKLLYWETFTAPWREIRDNVRVIVLLSTLLVAATAGLVAVTAHALGLGWVRHGSWAPPWPPPVSSPLSSAVCG